MRMGLVRRALVWYDYVRAHDHEPFVSSMLMLSSLMVMHMADRTREKL